MTHNINPIQTGIAVALALAVVAFFFMFGGMSFFNQPQTAAVDQSQTLQNAPQGQSTQPIMPTDTAPITQLQMKDVVVGTGAVAESGDTVTVKYVGRLTDGTVFDASANHPETASGFTFPLGAGQVIKGWDQGVAGMREGGKRVLLIPASLAYGDRAIGNIIPANSALIFEVELLKVQKVGR
jgi:FKBP-type peptidyl-prolyl cis-trans isomerase